MSWAETIKINSNMGVPINEQLRNNRFMPVRIITEAGTYTPEKSGYYKVICVGAGGSGYARKRSGSNAYYDTSCGGAGGVAIKTYHLLSTESYTVSIDTSVTFNNELTATRGGSGNSNSNGAGGTASGGDYNFSGGTSGGYCEANDGTKGASVGCFISELSEKIPFFGTNNTVINSGMGILGHGQSGAICVDTSGNILYQAAGSGACIIIPLEYDV